MSHNSDASAELGAASNMGIDPHIRPQNDAQNDEVPQALIQQLAADDLGAPADDTGLISPTMRTLLKNCNRPQGATTAPGHDSPAEEVDDEEEDVRNHDARSKDDDWEPNTSSARRTPRHTSSTYHPPTEESAFSSKIVQALQAARPKKWDKNNIPPYRDHLMSEMGRRIKDMERIMTQFASPEVDYDNRSDPTGVQKWAEKAVRRISDHLQELREVKRDIDDLNAYWLHWLWSISPTHLDREKTLRDQYIDADDEGGFASVCRRYEERYRRLRADYGDAKDAVTWSKAQIEQQWKMELAQIAQGSRTPTPAPTVEIPERTADGTTMTMPANGARTDASRTNAVPAASHVSTATTASRPTDTTNDFENRMSTLGKVASLPLSNSADSAFGTGQSTTHKSTNAQNSRSTQPRASEGGLKPSTFGNTTAQSILRNATPRQSLFDFGGGFRRAHTGSSPTNVGSTESTAHTSQTGWNRQQIRFANNDEVIPVTPRETRQLNAPLPLSREEQLRQFYTPVTSQQNQTLFALQPTQTRPPPAQVQSTSAASQIRTSSGIAQIHVRQFPDKDLVAHSAEPD